MDFADLVKDAKSVARFPPSCQFQVRFSRNDRTVKVIYFMADELKKKRYSSRQFISGDAHVYRFTHSGQHYAVSEPHHCTTYSIKNTHFFTGKRIVTASKGYFSIVVPRLNGKVFPTFVAKRQRI